MNVRLYAPWHLSLLSGFQFLNFKSILRAICSQDKKVAFKWRQRDIPKTTEKDNNKYI